jgi:hypothetical protein
MLTRRQWLLSTPAFAGANALRAESIQPQLIKAGPFSIQCPAGWAESVVAEKVPTNPLYTHEQWLAFKANPANQLKPSYPNRPEHWAIRFPKLATSDTVPLSRFNGSVNAPQVFIHHTIDWAGILDTRNASESNRRDGINVLRAEFEKMLSQPKSFRVPLLVLEGAFEFVSLQRILKFSGGQGVRMVTQCDIEATLLCRERFQYLFVGMSDDDSCYIVASFPLKLEELPSGRDENAKHIGFDLTDYDHLLRNFEKYQTQAVQWLAQREDLIEPKLTALDTMIESLRAVTWE